MADELPRYLDKRQLAEMLGVSDTTIERLQLKGSLPASIRLGRCRRWPLASVKKWLAEVEAEGLAPTA
ncbi:MAG: helix-turn-helix domain-containing protein [Gemmatales bacterium]